MIDARVDNDAAEPGKEGEDKGGVRYAVIRRVASLVVSVDSPTAVDPWFGHADGRTTRALQCRTDR